MSAAAGLSLGLHGASLPARSTALGKRNQQAAGRGRHQEVYSCSIRFLLRSSERWPAASYPHLGRRIAYPLVYKGRLPPFPVEVTTPRLRREPARRQWRAGLEQSPTHPFIGVSARFQTETKCAAPPRRSNFREGLQWLYLRVARRDRAYHAGMWQAVCYPRAVRQAFPLAG